MANARRILLVAVLSLVMLPPAEAATRRVSLGDNLIAALTDEQLIFLETTPLQGEGLLRLSRRLTGSDRAAKVISEANGKPRRLLAGVRYRIPFGVLTGELKRRVLTGLFPGDSARSEGWLHTVPAEGGSHSLWRLAEWFTGDGQRFPALREANQLTDDAVAPGSSLLIPVALLRPELRVGLPPAETPFGVSYDDGHLVYRLKQGEALYSSVVVRFTGRTFAEDVNEMAGEIAKLNGIRDVTDMPIGQAIRVPFDLLLPEFLPLEDPRRAEYEKNRTESARYSNTVRTSTLEGITIVLDAGHGGQDPGTIHAGVRESVHVYDIMVRTKELLEARTAATVAPTTRDGATFRIHDRDVLPASSGHAVLTSPRYPIVDAAVGANLRWYLANSLHSAATRRTGDPRKTVFISIHADSLHSSLRGAMVYIPAASLTRGAYGKNESIYRKHKEVQERPRVDFSWKERIESEGLSRQLASSLLTSFRRQGLRIHPEKPVRDRIIRCRRCRAFVPAVVRRNAVPAKLLLEVCNLNNPQDRKLLTTREFRQKVAEAIVAGILDYYGETAEPALSTSSSP